MTDNGAERFANRLQIAAAKAAEDPGWKIEVLGAGFRVIYTFAIDGRFYTHENITTFRAVAHAPHNALTMAMDDLTHGVEKFMMANHA